MAVIRELGTPQGRITRKLTRGEIREMAALGDEECKQELELIEGKRRIEMELRNNIGKLIKAGGIECSLTNLNTEREKSRVSLIARDRGNTQEGIRIEGDKDGVKLGLFGEEAIPQQENIASLGGGATLSEVISTLNTLIDAIKEVGIIKKT